MEIEEYDQWTINYLRAAGVNGALLERVERLAQEVAHLKAQLAMLQPDPAQVRIDDLAADRAERIAQIKAGA